MSDKAQNKSPDSSKELAQDKSPEQQATAAAPENKSSTSTTSQSLQGVDELYKKVSEYYPNANLDRLKAAYEFSKKAHSGQVRRSGEEYIYHPIGVSLILADLKLDIDTLATALLHDTVEDTEVELSDIEREFGPSVALLVDGVTKISQMSFRNTHEKQGENIRKMIMAMGKDVRVILVKLADRLHNMRTLNHMPPHKQQRIAQETLDIYAPLASRLGISSIKIELEDLSFRYGNPEAFYSLVQKVAKKKKEREKYIEEVKHVLDIELKKGKFGFEVQGRPKHLYSIFRKMSTRNIEYEQVYDVLAFRILVNNISACYEVLGLVHSLWKPIPGRFKDFIAMPKTNNYQSLHTTVIGPMGERIEIQIRTHEMHLVAEQGIAAHWSYKEGGKVENSTVQKFSWVRELVQQHQQTNDADEFLESIKTDLFEHEIYVFTPKGDVKEFPDGATPLDFAYSIHTDVGNTCVAARVNGRIVPLKYKLKNGDSIEILTSKNQQPSKDWLKFCVTSRAQSKIRWFVKNEQRKKAYELGKELLDKAFRRNGAKASRFLEGELYDKLLKDWAISDLDDLYVKIGYGKVMAPDVVQRLMPKEESVEEKDESTFIERVFKSATTKRRKKDSIIRVDGMADILVHFAKCCTPIPGDPITGFITRGRGITVHTSACPKAFEMDQERRVDVEWSTPEGSAGLERTAKVRVVTHDVPGLLQLMSEAFALNNINILNAQIRTTKDRKAVCTFDISVRDTRHLHDAIQSLQRIKGVIGVTRVTQV